ncbi:phytase [Clostridium botulinum]|uniref:Phytase n=1 Tax=Clostridium botulinum TaxID=1491 RepID=A0A6B4JNB2_CLOBO|nr:phytase [Clostridium botulinum]EES48869.1 protein tyrosine phosphatase II superfamily protein [Clostridium botulinum E1 str. 'BoNT E Beluga']MBN1070419.1 phytase [Clostridium botulinum]MBY6761502.1 phytase [Clostridium botulinum]MBY6920166.1 phytase [Clostridium botulinum]MCR1131057.1 phytase [Clostridium botulinum]
MYKKAKLKLYIPMLLLITIFSSFFLNFNIALAFNEPNNKSDVHIIVDNLRTNKIPSNFRTTSNLTNIKNNSSLNLKGLETLNTSGSQQFSKDNLDILTKSIDSTLPILVIDLRQESHGFVNEFPISFANEKNDANLGLSKSAVTFTEKKDLKSIKLNTPLTFYKHPEINVVPKEVLSEKQLTKSYSLNYSRVPVTDTKLPTNEMVDCFINIVKECSKENWLHFHCKAGFGRTTTFMIMYDMIKNYNNATYDEIIKRQFALANFDEKEIIELSSSDRINFLNQFYNYCKDVNGNFDTTWSSWLNDSQKH